jgi:predicted kinase
MLQRAARGVDASDAGPEIADLMAQRFASWPTARLVDTAQPWDVTCANLRKVVP